ncbi:MAG TPA: glycosyltransferase family 2 protein [Bryobacteraceae bacterium]|nr:glycosyltransferase family 2 protein [Bryobacteraceae bacterium]
MTGYPVFSIVVPTYNRPRRLAGFLESLTRLDYRRDGFEVVLVDDGSEADLEPVAAAFRDRLNIVFLRQSHGGVARGRHAGATAARGKYLAFTDDDCMPSPGWLAELERTLEATPSCMAGGRTENALPRNLFSTASQVLITYLYERFNADPRDALFFAGNNVAMPRDLYHRIGGLDVTWPMCGEDRDLCARWRSEAYPMIFAPQAVVHHAHDLDLRRFWKQHFNYGRGARRFHKTCAQRGDRRSSKLERLPFYCSLVAAAFRHVQGPRALPVAALLVLSQAANIAGFLREWIRPSDLAPTWQVEATR